MNTAFATELEDLPKPTREAWRALAEVDLKGAPFEKKLVTHTYEGIDVQPLYTESDHPNHDDPSGFPGLPPMTRAATPSGGPWTIAAEHLHPDPHETNRLLLEDLDGGAGAILLRSDASAARGEDGDAPDALADAGWHGVMLYTLGDLRDALSEVRMEAAPVGLETGGAFIAQAAMLAAVQRERRQTETAAVLFGSDPLAALARTGEIPRSIDQALRLTADLAVWTSQNAPRSRAVTVSTSPYHDGGATAAQDLAFSLATGVTYLRAMTAAGLTVDAALGQMLLSFSVGTNFFLAIAKLRAARKLWARVAAESGATPSASGTALHVRTSRRVLTTRDPHVNILRNTVACFAAAVAGAQLVTTEPFDAALGLPTDFARRVSRNAQVILQEESHLASVIDPAGGSYFVERLTEELCERAWATFREIEALGGMPEAITSGWVSRQIDSAFAPRMKNLTRRKDAITGVSEFPNVAEEKVEPAKVDIGALRAQMVRRLRDWRAAHPHAADAVHRLKDAARDALGTGASGEIMELAVQAAITGATIGQISAALLIGQEPTHAPAVALHPFAEPFEHLRDACDAHLANTGRRPKVFLANLGPLAHSTARSAYARNFFEAGGLEVLSSEPLPDADAAVAATVASGANVAVLCSSDKLYPTFVPQVAPRLAGRVRTVILAGNPGPAEKTYREAGVGRFIFIGCPVVEILTEVLKEEGVLL